MAVFKVCQGKSVKECIEQIEKEAKIGLDITDDIITVIKLRSKIVDRLRQQVIVIDENKSNFLQLLQILRNSREMFIEATA